MSNDNLVESIKSAIADGNYEEARTLLRVALKEPTAEIFHLAAQVALNEQQRVSFLQKGNSIKAEQIDSDPKRDLLSLPAKPKIKTKKPTSQLNIRQRLAKGIELSASSLIVSGFFLYVFNILEPIYVRKGFLPVTFGSAASWLLIGVIWANQIKGYWGSVFTGALIGLIGLVAIVFQLGYEISLIPVTTISISLAPIIWLLWYRFRHND
jgi:hypothetical protein